MHNHGVLQKMGQWKKSCISLICEESDSLASAKSMTKEEEEKKHYYQANFTDRHFMR